MASIQLWILLVLVCIIICPTTIADRNCKHAWNLYQEEHAVKLTEVCHGAPEHANTEFWGDCCTHYLGLKCVERLIPQCEAKVEDTIKSLEEHDLCENVEVDHCGSVPHHANENDGDSSVSKDHNDAKPMGRQANQPPKKGSQPPKPGSQPPKPGSQPPKPGGQPPKPGGQPPKPGGQPPKPGGQPPKPGGQPPKPGGQPPKPGGQPPKPGGQPPKPGGQPPKPGGQPPKPGGQPPKPGGQPPKPGGQPPKKENNTGAEEPPKNDTRAEEPGKNNTGAEEPPKNGTTVEAGEVGSSNDTDHTPPGTSPVATTEHGDKSTARTTKKPGHEKLEEDDHSASFPFGSTIAIQFGCVFASVILFVF